MNNLPGLKVGDQVLITFTKYGETTIRGQHEIERQTKTLFIVNGEKFRKKDHQEHAARDAWSGRTEIIPANSEEAQLLIQTARIQEARFLFRESVNRPDRDLTELQTALESRKLLDAYIRLLGNDDR
ncbi:hypothetical protein [Glutamicibacter sp. MCAF14]|uniref:hypothetical protein n=1 Tax=Glutamicibacter sp. MCAF14 TaxID=3233043 RepID=UPI003F9026D6